MIEMVLEGCRPIPLASYLKALGILRLVAEQADPNARGWWERDRFRLRTTLGREELIGFFLCDYRPTPIIAPWNGRAGFLEGDSEDGEASNRTGAQLIREYGAAHAPRFGALKAAVAAFSTLPVVKELDAARAEAKELAKNRKPSDEERSRKKEVDARVERAKAQLLARIRAEVAEDQFAWLDVCIRLADQNANSPLLIGGGSDGSRDYGMAFGVALQKLFSSQDGRPLEGRSGPWLCSALFGEAGLFPEKDSMGHLAPGQGGYNASTGYEGNNASNPWELVLALEGAVLWTGGATRRLDSTDEASAASFPFSVNLSRAGGGQLSAADRNRTPGELWCPLWNRAAGLREIKAFFREGRLTVGKRAARTGLDAVLAVRMLGRSRGIDGFVRIGLYQSDSKMPHTAAELGRHRTGASPDAAALALELADHPWLGALRREARSKEAPNELQQVVREIENRLFEMASQTAGETQVQDVLVAVGRAARTIANRPKLQTALKPPPELSSSWIKAADDRSAEFRLAVALAGLRAYLKSDDDDEPLGRGKGDPRKGRQFGLPMNTHLGPLDPENRQWSMEKGEALAVWGTGRLVDNLCAVAQRRLVEQGRRGLAEVPFDGAFDPEQNAPVAVDSGEIAAFLDGTEPDERIAGLLLGLAWVRPARWTDAGPASPLPFSYAALKPLFTPSSVFERMKRDGRLDGDVPKLPMPPSLPTLLMAGRVQEAVQSAQERVRASGLPTPFLPRRSLAPRRAPDLRFGRRLLAALIIPARAGVVADCLKQAYPTSNPEKQNAA